MRRILSFIDYQRAVELWDTKYLGHSATAWSGGASYSIGNIVSSSDPTVYWSLTVNYRYINAAGCSSSNPQPGLVATPTWRNCWEWASLYDLRQAIAAGTTYTDASISCVACSPTKALINWIRRGYTPTNNALRGAAHDGTDIGAVQMDPPAPSSGAGTCVASVAVLRSKICP